MKHYYSDRQAVPLALEWFDYRPLLYIFLVLSLILLGMNPSLGKSSDNQPWTLHSTSGNVSVYYMFSKCEQQDVVLIKFYNAGDAAIEVAWKEKFSLNGKDISVNNQEYKKQLLFPGETSLENCADNTVLVTPANKYVSLLMPGLTGFDLYDFVFITQK